MPPAASLPRGQGQADLAGMVGGASEPPWVWRYRRTWGREVACTAIAGATDTSHDVEGRMRDPGGWGDAYDHVVSAKLLRSHSDCSRARPFYSVLSALVGST